jgi:hypothetical protein
MSTAHIIFQIDQEIALLTKAKELLQGTAVKKGPGRPRADATTAPIAKKKSARRKMSAEARARIAAAQKARWAKVRAKKT